MHRRDRSGFFAASELYGARDQTNKKSTSPKPGREAKFRVYRTGGWGCKVLPVGSTRPSFSCTQETDRNFGRNRCDHRPKLLTNTSTSLTRWMFRKPHTASAHLVCKTRRVEAHFQSNVVEKAPSGSAAVAAGHLNPPTPRPRGSAWGWACYPGDRKLSVREVQYRGVETVSTTGGWGAQTARMGLSGGALGRSAPVGRRKWKSKVFLKENIGF